METVFVIVCIVFVVIYLLAQDSKKETTKEKYGDAVASLAHMTADGISGIAHDITEPASKKKLRLAKEELAIRHESLYRMLHYNQKDYIEELLTVDDKFRKSLELLGLSEDRWKQIALHIFYVGAIRVCSRESSDYSKKNSVAMRKNIINEWSDFGLKDQVDTLKDALIYFNIPIEEWIKYGDTVLEMHDVNNNADVEEFGYIVQIKPMQNNLHLL